MSSPSPPKTCGTRAATPRHARTRALADGVCSRYHPRRRYSGRHPGPVPLLACGHVPPHPALQDTGLADGVRTGESGDALWREVVRVGVYGSLMHALRTELRIDYCCLRKSNGRTPPTCTVPTVHPPPLWGPWRRVTTEPCLEHMHFGVHQSDGCSNKKMSTAVGYPAGHH